MHTRLKYVIGGVALVAAVGAFAVFRPDTLFTDTTVDETIDPRVAAALEATASSTSAPPPDEAVPTSPEVVTDPSTTTTPPVVETTVPQPAVVSSGSWTSIEHETTGTVAVVADGAAATLVMTELETSNGPDLAVYLSPADPATARDSIAGAVRLGPLKGNLGTQTYEIPAGTDLSSFGSVLIWCDRFSVGFGVAGLTPA